MRAYVLFVSALGLLVLNCIDARASESATYSFTDEATGLTLDLPKAWERRDPADATLELVETNERFWRRKHEPTTGAVALFAALARPYQGPANTRSTLSCFSMASPVDRKLEPHEITTVLQSGIEATFGQRERNVAISEPKKVSLKGQEAYRVLVDRQTADAPSAQFVVLQRGERIIQCFGIFDATFQDAANAALASIRFAAAVVPSAHPLRGVYEKMGCTVPAFDAMLYHGQRERGATREDFLRLQVKITYPMRKEKFGLKEKEYSEYVKQVTQDVYDHPALAPEDLSAYETYKCQSILQGATPRSLESYVASLSACPAQQDRQACRERLLSHP